MSLIETLKQKQDAQAATLTAARESLAAALYAEAQGKPLTSKQSEDASDAAATLGYGADEVAELAADLAALAQAERSNDELQVARKAQADAQAADNAHGAKRDAFFTAWKAEAEAISATSLAADGRVRNLEGATIRLAELRAKYWKAAGVTDPDRVAKRRHLVSSIRGEVHESPDVETIDLEKKVFVRPWDFHAVLTDASIEWLPYPGQSKKDLAALLLIARKVVEWHHASNLLNTSREPIGCAVYLTTDDDATDYKCRFNRPRDLIALLRDERQRCDWMPWIDGRIYLVPMPGADLDKFNADRVRIERVIATAKGDAEADENAEPYEAGTRTTNVNVGPVTLGSI